MGVDGRREQRARRRMAAALLASSTLFWAASGVHARPSAPASSAAPAPSVSLSWSEPEGEVGCLGAEGLARSVSEYLGRQAFSPSPADVTLQVRVERKPERGWRALLKLVDLTGALLGERELDSDGALCTSLDEPLQLAVALMVDSELVASAEPEPAPSPEPPEPPESPEAQPEPGVPWVISADASALIERGLLPKATAGLELGLELRTSDWLSLRGSGVGFLPSSVALGGPARAKMFIIYGGLSLCPQGALSGRIRLSACAGLVAGTLFANTTGLERARSTRRRVFAATFGLRASLKLSQRWALLAQIAGVAPYRPERFVYQLNEKPSEFFRMSAPSLVAGIGGSVTF